MRKEDKYFAAQEPEDCAAKVIDKVDSWHNTLEATGYMNKLEDMYAAYHGAYYTSVGEAHQITFGGDSGELTELVVNHLGNIGRHMLNMTTSTRPALEARAVNTDYKSLSQVGLANGLLDYYLREKKLEEYLIDAVERSIVLGSAWIKLAWNPSIGDVINQDKIDEANEINDDEGEEVIEVPEPQLGGDLVFNTLSPMDVVLDLTKEGRDHDWIICRSYKNRFDLIAQYPEFEQEILSIDPKSKIDRIRVGNMYDDETDDIPVYEFYHEKTPSVPEGRYMFFVSSDAVLHDGELPYRHIPVYPIYPGKILGTPLGYSTLFDMLPIQDAMNSLYSAALSNANAFAVQNILNPSGSNIDINQISGGLNILDYNPVGGKPEALQLLNTPPEVFNFLNMLNQLGETITGVNSVVRGNPEANLRSANAIAMIQSNAIQFMSGLQRSYIHLLENVGLGIIEILQDFADTKRVASIVGVSGRPYLKEFKGEDLAQINRVFVDTANPLTKTVAGKSNMADNLLQYGAIDAKNYMAVLHTGKLDIAVDQANSETLLIKSENEGFLRGEPQPVIDIDDHVRHINEHKALLNDRMLRRNPELLQIVLGHINDHKIALQSADPALLQITGQQPIPPMQNPEGGNQAPQDPNQQPPDQQALEGMETGMQDQNMPEGFEESPLTPQQGFANTAGFEPEE